MATCGIYSIKNTVNGKMYIGKSTDISKRFARHRTLLKTGKHYNRHLLRAYNKYGAESMEYIVLERCSSRDLSKLEQKWIDSTDRMLLYNSQYFVENLHQERNPFFGKHHTEDARCRMSKLKAGKYLGAANPNFGNTWSLDQRLRMCGNKNVNAKLTPTDVASIRRRLATGETHASIASDFEVSRTVITRINNGTRWQNISMED